LAMISKAIVDFPDPDTPTKHTTLLRGMVKSMFLRLFSLAPFMTILSIGVFQQELITFTSGVARHRQVAYNNLLRYVIVNKMNNLITAGELARLAGTTKRTILWYDELGIIKPVEVSPEGYRYYSEAQVLDYQMILMLSTLGVSLKEIKAKNDLKSLFKEKKASIKSQIDNLQFSLKNLEKFVLNLDQNKTLIKPEIKTLKPFDVYYIEKVGSYVNIGKYCRELSEMFTNKGKDFTTLAIFNNPTYQPKKSLIKIAVLFSPGMSVDPKYKDIVKKIKFDPGKVITYTHNGAGEMLSLFWKELEKYCRLNKIEIRHDIPDFEIYRKVNPDPKKQFFEIYLPIR